jgi:hypothetical protein
MESFLLGDTGTWSFISSSGFEIIFITSLSVPGTNRRIYSSCLHTSAKLDLNAAITLSKLFCVTFESTNLPVILLEVSDRLGNPGVYPMLE